MIDAVIVTRIGPPFGDDSTRDIKQTNLYLVESGKEIPNEPSFLRTELTSYVEKIKRDTVLAGFDIDNISLKWLGNNRILVFSTKPSTEINKVGSLEISYGNHMAKVWVDIVWQPYG